MKSNKLTIVLLILLVIPLVSSMPPLPHEFYGRATFFSNAATAGTVIAAEDPSGQSCGNFTVTVEGYYGLLTCKGDDSETGADEGGTSGNNITFYYNGLLPSQIVVTGEGLWTEGEFSRIDLVYPPLVCDDGYCDDRENATACPEDCAEPDPGNTTGNGTGGGDTEGGGGGGGGGGGVSPDDSAAGGAAFTCDSNWVCTEWEPCRIDSTQVRVCDDENNCGSETNKPAEVQQCEYIPTCFDGVRNGLETGVDCGGPCGQCDHCFDGVQNFGELDIDCGGPCDACPTCFDGVQNQGEKGIDCEGPCDADCPGLRLELPKRICIRVIDPFNIFFIIFVALILLSITADVVYARMRINSIRKNKDMKEMQKLRKIAKIERHMYLFLTSVLVISIILILYYYFFGICTDNAQWLWLLVVALILSPVIIHKIMKYYEYNEKQRIAKVRKLHDVHYREIQRLIDIENTHIMELEEELSEMIRKLQTDPKFMAVLEKEPKLKEIYKDITELYKHYIDKTITIKEEKKLVDEIWDVLSKEEFKALAEKEPALHLVADKLRILYEEYEYKQELLDEQQKEESTKTIEELERNLADPHASVYDPKEEPPDLTLPERKEEEPEEEKKEEGKEEKKEGEDKPEEGEKKEDEGSGEEGGENKN